MRKKLLWVLAGALLVLVGAYASFWFYQAGQIKKSAESTLQQFSQRLSQSGATFTYSSLKVTGFPARYKLVLEKPSVTSKQGNDTVSIKADGDIALEAAVADIFSKRPLFKLEIPASGSADVVQDGKALAFGFKCQGSPDIQFAFDPNAAGTRMELGNVVEFLSKTPLDRVEQFSYADQGCEFINMTTGKLISKTNGSLFHYSNEPQGVDRRIVTLKTSSQAIHLGEGYFDIYAGSGSLNPQLVSELASVMDRVGDSNIDIDLTYEGPLTMAPTMVLSAKLTVRKFEISNALFGIVLTGQAEGVQDEMWPVFSITLGLRNYKEMVNYTATLFNISAKLGPVPEGTTSPIALEAAQIEAAKEFLRKIAGADAVATDLTIIIRREKGKDMQVGTLTLPQLVTLYEETFSQVQPAAPTQPVIPAPAVQAP